jgi:multimeric flavodoxin WrbA
MNTILLVDKDSKTELSESLKTRIIEIVKEKGHNIEIVELGRDDASPCLGCFSCLTKHPGECVSKDAVNEVKKNAQKYGMTIYMTPVIFGHFSSTIKNAIDKGTGSHDLQVIIGYGGDIDDEEASTFIDLTQKHRGSADIVHPGMDKQVDVYITRSTEDNTAICQAFKGYV